MGALGGGANGCSRRLQCQKHSLYRLAPCLM
jgi:hypothetical protein